MLWHWFEQGTADRTALRPVAVTSWMRKAIDEWGRAWGDPSLGAEVHVEFSSRLRTSLGRALPDRQLVRLHSRLREAPRSLVREVLCHEVAHVAAHRLGGAAARGHGEAWAALVVAAGYAPRVTLRTDVLVESGARSKPSYTHVCPVCQFTRLARRPMHRWRCERCVGQGLGGALEIRRRH